MSVNVLSVIPYCQVNFRRACYPCGNIYYHIYLFFNGNINILFLTFYLTVVSPVEPLAVICMTVTLNCPRIAQTFHDSLVTCFVL